VINSKDRSALKSWLTCVSRGSHAFDDYGLCLDCGAERGSPSITDITQSEANRRAGRIS